MDGELSRLASHVGYDPIAVVGGAVRMEAHPENGAGAFQQTGKKEIERTGIAIVFETRKRVDEAAADKFAVGAVEGCHDVRAV